jgi:hypothetical protein
MQTRICRGTEQAGCGRQNVDMPGIKPCKQIDAGRGSTTKNLGQILFLVLIAAFDLPGCGGEDVDLPGLDPDWTLGMVNADAFLISVLN